MAKKPNAKKAKEIKPSESLEKVEDILEYSKGSADKVLEGMKKIIEGAKDFCKNLNK